MRDVVMIWFDVLRLQAGPASRSAPRRFARRLSPHSAASRAMSPDRFVSLSVRRPNDAASSWEYFRNGIFINS